MANKLYREYGSRNAGGFGQIIQQVKEMQKSFQGDPKAEVERLMRSGQMSQDQYNQLAQMASPIMPYLK